MEAHEWYGTKQQMVIDELTAEKEAHATTRKEVKKATGIERGPRETPREG
jgi:hypothetical protein